MHVMVSPKLDRPPINEVVCGFGFGEVPREVIAFLSREPQVVDTLRDAGTRLQRLFPAANGALMQIALYREEDSHLEELLVSVPTNTSVDQAMDRLATFDSWWLEQPRAIRRLVTFDIEYV
ncbi:MAG: hypothetical protein Tsb0020_54100 [Haliangiales bacterium]